MKKITDLVLSESFMQINTIRGYRFIEKSGEIINLFHSEKKTPPLFNLDMNGLLIKNPIENIIELKVNANMIWFRYMNLLDAKTNIKSFITLTDKILDVLDVSEISRIGWRTRYIFPFKNEIEFNNFFQSIVKIEGINESEIKTSFFPGNNLQAYLQIIPVQNNNKEFGVLIDVDIFLVEEHTTKDIDKYLMKFWDYLNEKNGFLKILNSMFK